MEKKNGVNTTSNGIANFNYPRKQSRGSNSIQFQGTYTAKRSDVTKWNGWGYRDSYFYQENGILKFNGDRYPLCNIDMPYFKNHVKDMINGDIDDNYPVKEMEIPKDYKFQKSKITEKQLKALQKLPLKISMEGSDRLYRSHGQTNDEIDRVINNTIERIPDVVMWPECHEDVVEIIKICNDENIAIIPFGGGTCVNKGVCCPKEEQRPILSLDMCLMNEILSIDEESLVACFESGIVGQDIERELKKMGYTLGHEPDSIEFSSLGGWVSTRASGMKKNAYGNIEDLVVHVRLATPSGVLEKSNRVPRLSCGPDFNHLILGSEGCFGVVTEVTLKIRPMPTCFKFGSYIFPDFQTGAACLREVARQQCQPASLRLMDNAQFQLGRSFREEPSLYQQILDKFAKFYISNIKGVDFSKISVATVKYEGDEDVVKGQEKKINEIALEYGGISSGAIHGERGYNMTFAIAYIRDFSIFLNMASESFETSVPWDQLFSLIENSEKSFAESCKKYEVVNYVLTYRLAQVYDAGACVYFYLIFHAPHLKDKIHVCDTIVKNARDVMLEHGGCISHHHGVGKVRAKWYERTVSPLGLEIYKTCKAKLDPKNIFASMNFIDGEK